MKRRDLVAELEQAGCLLLRHGAKHDIYHNPKNGRSEPVPRHREINPGKFSRHWSSPKAEPAITIRLNQVSLAAT